MAHQFLQICILIMQWGFNIGILDIQIHLSKYIIRKTPIPSSVSLYTYVLNSLDGHHLPIYLSCKTSSSPSYAVPFNCGVYFQVTKVVHLQQLTS